MTKKRENLLLWNCSVTMAKKVAYISSKIATPKSFFNFSSQKEMTSFSYQHSISFTHRSQHYRFLGQANLYRLYGLWQMPTQIWMVFMVQNLPIYLVLKHKGFQERRQLKLPIVTKSYNGIDKFQPVYAIEESAGTCRREFC